MQFQKGKIYKAKSKTPYLVQTPIEAFYILTQCKPFMLIDSTEEGIIVLCGVKPSKPFAIYKEELELFEEIV